MSGSEILSESEREEMLQDSLQECRGQAFLAARLRSQSGSLDDYIEFLSRHTGLFPFAPRRSLTDDFRL